MEGGRIESIQSPKACDECATAREGQRLSCDRNRTSRSEATSVRLGSCECCWDGPGKVVGC